MVWDLLWLGVCGVLIGGLGRLAVPGPNPMSWPRTLLLGLGGTLGGGLVTGIVLGRGHGLVWLLISVGLAALLVSGYGAYRRARGIPPG
ncbi:hypothetical protein KDL01_31955 [Actinospica durhamensis]|uniref:GlsB/YeaQ/YmgE family stress response membrane protein n=1 Tax=Actinospica durhamensis TaxID=1508375 RepID=A0A941IQQ1_9ACTN|nr:hypothetical protein [Actinospica durhamensis]MBR7837930.1 hypothetical protein [Actinospica durhamensis]